MLNTISGKESALVGVIFSVYGGKWYIRKNEFGSYEVLGSNGDVIGCAHRYTYGERGWTIETAPYAGFAPNDQVIEIEG